VELGAAKFSADTRTTDHVERGLGISWGNCARAYRFVDFSRREVLKDSNGTKQGLKTAQDLTCNVLKSAIGEFTTKYPDSTLPEVELQPNGAMKPRNMYFATAVLLH
jgi:hypothetical protein